MKRRRFIQAISIAPAAPALMAQQPAGRSSAPQVEETPKLEVAQPDAAAEMVPHFFTAQQFDALRRLCDMLMPPLNGQPGALDAEAPEFLDFLIGASPDDRQQVYLAGLDALHARKFAQLDRAQADVVLAPLGEPWTYDTPHDPLAAFLLAAKHDVRTATMNSREWSAAGASGGGRRAGGMGLYWYPLE